VSYNGPDNAPTEPQEASLANPAASITGTVPPASASAGKRRRNWLILAGVVVAVLFLCMSLCCIVSGSIFAQTWRDRPHIQGVIDEFMREMAAKDANKAYTLFSTRGKKSTPLADLQALLQGSNYELFRSYQSVTIANLYPHVTFSADPNMPRGTIAQVEGSVYYSDGFTGELVAVLEKEADQWCLFSIWVTVPPDKIGNRP
jgi:hypothetical protein